MKRRSLIERMDILRSATLLIEEYGAHASEQATLRVADFRSRGDLDGQQTWLAVHRAITALTYRKTGKTASAGHTIH
jgi:hypothetical protein